MKDLLEIREEIDRIDGQMIELYEKRMECTAQVAEYKISTGKKIFDKEREQAKLEKAESLASNTFNKRSVRELFEHIMSMSRKRQYQILTEQGLTKKPDFICEDKLDFTKARVVFQGVEGAYSEAAMKEFFGSDTDRSSTFYGRQIFCSGTGTA